MVKFFGWQKLREAKKKMPPALVPVIFIGLSVLMAACRQPTGGGDSPPPAPVVEWVTVSPNGLSYGTGRTVQFAAVVTPAGVSQEVTWTLLAGSQSPGTTVTLNGGLLTIAADETARTLSVKATSVLNNSKYGVGTITVIPPEGLPVVNTVIVSPAVSSVSRGDSVRFTARVEGSSEEINQVVTWALAGNHVTGTTLTQNEEGALLTIAADETAANLTVTATSVTDTSKSGTATVTVIVPGENPDIPQLSAPTGPTLNEQGVASWSPVEHAVSYSVSLYRDGVQKGSHAVNTGTELTHNFLSDIRQGGPGSYTIKVRANGDGVNYQASPELESEVQKVTQQPPLQYVWWANSTIAHWDFVDGVQNVSDYIVGVYLSESWQKDAPEGTSYIDTEDGKQKGYVDLLPIMEEKGSGSYTFRVYVKGNGYLILDGEVGTVETAYNYHPSLGGPEDLAVVQNVALTAEGKATWDAAADETHVAAYSIQIWKGGGASNTPVGERILVAKDTGKTESKYTYDLIPVLRGLEDAHYGISIIAIAAAGSGVEDSLDTDNTIPGAWQEVRKNLSVQHAWWHEETKARWVNVDGSSNYAVQLYRDGTALGEAVSVTRQNEANPGGGAGETITTHDFSSAITSGGAGTYTFRVLTKGAGYLIPDVEEKVSGGYVYSPVDPVDPSKGAVTVTFKPANESGLLSVTGAASSISKTGGSATITLEVSGEGFTGFTWVVDGQRITAAGGGITPNGATLTINAANAAIRLGGHSVMVYATKNGVFWSPVNPVGFTVTR